MEVGQLGASLGNAIEGTVSAIASILHVSGGAPPANTTDFIAPSPNFTDARGRPEQSTKTAGETEVDRSVFLK